MERFSRRKAIILTAAAASAALAAYGPAVTPDSPVTPISKPLVKEPPKNPDPELGAIRETKVGDWDPLIDAFIKESPPAQTAIQKGYEDGINFFAVSITHRHGTPMDNKRGIMILPVSPDLPEKIAGVDQTIFYAIGTRDGQLFPFPERSHIGSLKYTPSSIVGRKVLEERNEALINKNVTVVQTRVLGPGSQGKMEPGLGVVLLKDNPPKRIDAFLQIVKEKFLQQEPPSILEVTKEVPLVLLYFPAKIIERDGKILYTKSDPIA